MANIAIFTSPEGHLSIAQAIESTLTAHNHQVSVFFDQILINNFYKPMYQYVPGAMKLPFRLSQTEQSVKFLQDIFNRQYDKKIGDFYKKVQPDICISTYCMYNPSLQHFSDIANKPFINVITDPKTIHPLLIAPEADYNLAYDQTAADFCQQLSSRKGNCIPSGWFVKPEFETPYDQTEVRRKLDLNPDLLTILISSGSEGTTMIMKLLPFLVQLDKPIQIIIACGNNTALYSSVRGIQTLLKNVREKTHILPLEYVTNMHEYMMAADLVVGKAGPNSLFESVATLTPFFAITHISGQEDGNLDLIAEENLGFVEENPFKAQTLLESIVADPSVLDTFKSSLKKTADRNKRSKTKIIELVEKLTTN